MTKCRGSQELIYTQIPWASAGAKRSRDEREKNSEGNGRTKSQPDVQFSSPLSRDHHGMDANLYNAEGVEQTLEEELLDALLDANQALFGALRMYDDVMRVVEEEVAVEISRRDVKMDRRVSVFLMFVCIKSSVFCQFVIPISVLYPLTETDIWYSTWKMSTLENFTMIMEAAPHAPRHQYHHHLLRLANTTYLPLFPHKPTHFLGSLLRSPLPIRTMVLHHSP